LIKGVRVKMITGDHLTIAKETAKLLRMGTNIYQSDVLTRQDPEFGEDELSNLIEKADGFAGVFPEHKYKIVKVLKERGHITGMTGDGVNDAPALKVANIGVAVADATDAARSAAAIVLTEAGLSVIIDAIIESRKIFQRMKNYAIYACATTVRVVLSFSVLCFVWKYDQPPFLILIMAFVNDGTMLTISKDLVKPSPMPDAWKLKTIFSTAICMGIYLSISTVIFFYVIFQTQFFDNFGLYSPWRISRDSNDYILHSIIFLQVAISGQAMIFSTRAQTYWFLEKPGNWVILAFIVAQTISSLITSTANWTFTYIQGCGGGWLVAIWAWAILWHIPIDLVKFFGKSLTDVDSWKKTFSGNTAGVAIKDRGSQQLRMTQEQARAQMNNRLKVLRMTQLG